jgi:hypothetical protein
MTFTQRMDRALERHEEAKRALHRPDGTPKYVEDEMRERQRELEQEFRAEMDRLEEDVDRRIAETEGELLKLEHSDPSAALSARELEEANPRRAFAADEVYGLSEEALIQRLRAVLASDDRVGQYLYANLVRIKHAQETVKLRRLVAELARKLDPGREPRLKEARATIKELEGAKLQLAWRRQGARSASEGQRSPRLEEWRRRGTLTG